MSAIYFRGDNTEAFYRLLQRSDIHRFGQVLVHAGFPALLHILKEGGKLVWLSSQGLMDEAIDADTLATIDACVRRFEAERGGAVHSDRLNTRRAGAINFIDLHLHMPGDWSLAHATRLRMELEAALLRDVPNARITVEVLPIGVQTQSEVAEKNMP